MTATYHEDDQRMIRLQEGDPDAFDEIVSAWKSPLYGFFFRNTRDAQKSEDLVQDTLLKLYRKSWDYVPTGRFKGWLFRVARNLLIDTTRKASRDALVRPVTVATTADGQTTDILNLLADDVVSAEAKIMREEAANVVYELLEELPDEQRLTFTMHHFDALSLSEVADAMQTSLPTAKSRLRLAREKLKYQLSCRGYTDALVSEMN